MSATAANDSMTPCYLDVPCRRRAALRATRRFVPGCLLALALLTLAGPAAAQQTHVLVVTGLSGDPAYAEQFHGWATTLIDAAAERYELPAENVTWLAERADVDPDRVDGRSTSENVQAAVGGHRGAGRAERPRPDRAHRARQLPERRVAVQPAAARPDRRGLRVAARAGFRGGGSRS